MSSAIPSTSTLNKIPKVVIDRKLKDRSGKVSNSQVTVPAHQLSNLDHTEIVYTQSMKGVPRNLFRNNGTKFSATLEQKSFVKLISATIRVQLTHGGVDDVLVCPTTYWFNRIEFRSSDGSKHMNIVYNDNLHFALCTSGHNVYKSTKRLIGLSDLNLLGLADPNIAAPLKALDTKYIPLLGSWVENVDLWFRNIEGDIVVDFYPRSQLNIVGVVNESISVESMDFVIQTEELSEHDMQIQSRFHNQFASEHNFLDVVPVNFYNFKMQPGVTSKFELDAVTGDCAFMVMYITTQGAVNPTAHSALGDDARIDVLSPGSKSILGSGTGIELGYLKHRVLPNHFHNDFFLDYPNITVIPFCSSVSKSMFGIKSGSLYFDGSRHYLSITPGADFETKNYNVVIYAYKFATLLNNKGHLSIHSS
jgi:hypothetical protein